MTTPYRPAMLVTWSILFYALASTFVLAGESASQMPKIGGTTDVLYIQTIVPSVAAPGKVVKIFLSRKLRQPIAKSDYTVSIGGRRAEIISGESEALSVRVPEHLPEGVPISVVVVEGNTPTEPYPEFSVEPGPVERVWPLGILVLAVGAGAVPIVFVGLLRRMRREALRKDKELDRLRLLMERQGRAKSAPSTGEAETNQMREGDELSGDQAEVLAPEMPEGLVEACSTDDCVLFCGTGLSVQARYPTWRETLASLVDRASAKDDRSKWLELQRALDAGQPSVVAELLTSRLPREELLAGITELYGTPPKKLPSVCEALQSIPFANVLTTSWDSLLEKTFTARRPTVVTAGVSEKLPQLLQDNAFCIVKLYGDLASPESILFTAGEYHKAINDNPLYAKHLASLALSKTHFFLGARLATIEDYLSSLQLQLGPSSRTHFALVAEEGDIELQRERFWAKYGVRLISFRPTLGWPELKAGVEALRAAVADRRLNVPKTEVQATTLHKVTLQNIGPYRQLSVPFNPNWNVLLGNNGSGKSTLLRAIALGLCGDDAKAALCGQRLLRSNASSGIIELHVGRDVFRTELIRERDKVRVVCRQLTPLQAGHWVVLGFPPLRGISTRDPNGPSGRGSPSPVVEDLLPLIVGDIDTRLDSLKQWIVNVDVRSSPGGGVSPEQAERNKRLQGSFFDLLNEFTPGTSLKFASVDRNSWQVFVKTDDGVIPIGQVSQGMSSIFGWVGTLLQRMYEIYETKEHPEQEPALVLVDEVDAHLHPEWQQVLVPMLKKHFPKLQMIATSHSPLLVAGMKRNEVLIARRPGGDQEPIEVVPPPIDFEGMRADQILTSPLFGLVRTRNQRDIDRYSELLGKSSRTDPEEKEFQDLRKRLDRILTVGETSIERNVEQAVRQALDELSTPEKLLNQVASAQVTPEVELEIKRQLAKVLGREEDKP